MYDFFISHTSINKSLIVEPLVQELEKNNITVWYDKESILFGDDINQEIENGLKKSICLILIITKQFFESKWVFFEFGKYSAYEKARIIPVVYDITNEQYLQIIQILGNLKFINAKDKTFQEITELLISTLKVIKDSNESLLVKDQIYKLHRTIKSKEDLNSGLVCLALNEYFEISDKYSSYTIFCAKKVALEVMRDAVKILNICDTINFNDPSYYLSLIQDKLSKNVFEYLSFLVNSNIYSFDTDYYQIINKAMLAILQWYYSIKYNSIPLQKLEFEIINPGEMKHEDFKETDEIDYLVLREDLIASVDTAIEWYDYNYYTYLAIKDKKTNRIAGYITVLPITEDTYNQILSGDFMDKDFTKDSILLYDTPGLYSIYVASVAIHPKYQNSNAFFKLYNATIDMFLNLAKEREVYVEKIIAEASTKQGEKLCKLLHMQRFCSTTSNTDVYTLTLIPPEFKLFGSRGKVFMNLCKQKYEEYRDFFEEK